MVTLIGAEYSGLWGAALDKSGREIQQQIKTKRNKFIFHLCTE
ncbi:hypothetical protein PPIS_b0647 [Pseudoalteromonas piscicida]|uniref:Uncharacterized protein n=1 Tax=Pseudoalteromonas piscicida TaxID=43662 RepID=A0ABM6NL86_PSEO7|nr:hypothetical protein PPIS_b0647 [Pseudoalteromonas piscicida]